MAMFRRSSTRRTTCPACRVLRSCGHVSASCPHWRERLGEIIATTLGLHGEDDPFYPIGNGQALAAEIPDARLVRLDRAGHRLPAHAVPVVADELLAHTAD